MNLTYLSFDVCAIHSMILNGKTILRMFSERNCFINMEAVEMIIELISEHVENLSFDEIHSVLVHKETKQFLGEITFKSVYIEQPLSFSLNFIDQNNNSLKRSNFELESSQNGPAMKRAAQKLTQSPMKKDVTQVFKDLNLFPALNSVSDDLQCTLCSYNATMKTNLKTHYKLKHLNGADLSRDCNLCQKRCTTKSNLKAHLISVHKMTRDDAIKLAN